MTENTSEELNAFTVVDEANEEGDADNAEGEVVEDETDAVIEDTGEENNEETVEEVKEAAAVEEPEEQENDDSNLDNKTQNESTKTQNADKVEPETEHPYLELIESFEYPQEQTTITPLEPAKSIADTPLQLIETRVSLIKLLQTLRNVKEIAIDLLVDTRSYEKEIHVMMLSTRDTDYVIDVLKLKNELLLLSEIFINPKIVKIMFFKSTLLMTCLQHGLCLYIVNLFDVFKAAMVLFNQKCPQLNPLIKKHYSVVLPKKPDFFQKRPLKQVVLDYCRATTHYLIHMYHDYKNQLITKDEQLYKDLLQQCRDASKILHANQQENELQALERSMQNRHKAELELLKKMFAWRANVAKEFDKNPEEIIHEMGLLRFCSHLPTDVAYVNFLTRSEYIQKARDEIIPVVKEITAQYRPGYMKARIKKFQQEGKRNVPESSVPAPPNKKAKLESPNTSQSGGNQNPQFKRRRPSKLKREAIRLNRAAHGDFSNFNIQPFVNSLAATSVVNANARNSRFSPPRGNRYFEQTSNFRNNRGSNRNYDLDVVDRAVNNLQRRHNSLYQGRNNSRNPWRN